MYITSTEKQGEERVAILQLNGKLDGSNHMQLLDEVKKIHGKGGRNLLIDLEPLDLPEQRWYCGNPHNSFCYFAAFPFQRMDQAGCLTI